jgi:PAS domain S-box-containing protein
MIYKEEHILFPMSLEQLSQSEWKKVRSGEEEIGYSWVKPEGIWPSDAGPVGPDKAPIEMVPGPKKIFLEQGGLSQEQVNLILTHLPVDITFVDENDRVGYYSASKHRIFPRSPAIIGRHVQKCHPSKSVHIVEKILTEFKSGNRDSSEFWLQMKGRVIHIRYFAVRDSEGNYKGTMEVSQDLTEIKKLEGENRLLDWK